VSIGKTKTIRIQKKMTEQQNSIVKMCCMTAFCGCQQNFFAHIYLFTPERPKLVRKDARVCIFSVCHRLMIAWRRNENIPLSISTKALKFV